MSNCSDDCQHRKQRTFWAGEESSPPPPSAATPSAPPFCSVNITDYNSNIRYQTSSPSFLATLGFTPHCAKAALSADSSGLSCLQQKKSFFTRGNRKISPAILDTKSCVKKTCDRSLGDANATTSFAATNSLPSCDIMEELDIIISRPMPMYYWLDPKQSREISSSIAFGTLISRMKRCIFRTSMKIDRVNGNQLHLTTVEQVPLAVCFWDKPESKTIAVEIQSKAHRSPLHFLRAASCIFKFLEENVEAGSVSTEASAPTKGCADQLRKTESFIQQQITPLTQQDIHNHQQQNLLQEETLRALEQIASFFTESHSIQKGLERLCMMTDSNKVGVAVSDWTSRVLLFGDRASLELSHLAHFVLNLAFLGYQSSSSNVENDDRAESNSYQEFLSHFALTAVVNALEFQAKFSANDSSDMLSLFWERSRCQFQLGATEILIGFVRSANSNPHRAHLAVRALACLSESCDCPTRQKIAESIGLLLHRDEAATQRSYWLQLECTRLMRTLR